MRNNQCWPLRCRLSADVPGQALLPHRYAIQQLASRACRAGLGLLFQRETGAIIESNATCRDDAEATPLEILTNYLLLGYTERKYRTTEKVPLVNREALHTVVEAKLDGVPMVLDLYVMKRNGCIFDLSFASPPAQFSGGSAAFSQFVQGFVDESKS